MPSHDLLRMLDWDARAAARQSGAREPDVLAPALAADHRRRLTCLLQEFGDSYLGQEWTSFLLLAAKLGFRNLQDWETQSLRGRAWLHPAGPLLVADAYQNLVNQAQLVVRWQPPPNNIAPPGLQQYGGAWQGSLWVREGLAARWGQLQEGSFLPIDVHLIAQLEAPLDPDLWPRWARWALKK